MGRKVKLDAGQVADIRQGYKITTKTYKEIAQYFGVSVLTISKVIRGEGAYKPEVLPLTMMPEEERDLGPADAEEPSPSQFDEGVDRPNEQAN